MLKIGRSSPYELEPILPIGIGSLKGTNHTPANEVLELCGRLGSRIVTTIPWLGPRCLIVNYIRLILKTALELQGLDVTDASDISIPETSTTLIQMDIVRRRLRAALPKLLLL
jgi:hypothetical protein